MLELFNKTKEWFLDILLPKFCVGCGREGLYICKDCEIFLSEVDPCVIGYQVSKWDTRYPITDTVSVWEYEGLMEKLIHKIKFDGCYHIIDELVEKAMAKVGLNLPVDTYIITYVPMHRKRERQRGFNQSELIARKLSQLLGLAEQPMLEKVRDNRSQVGLGPKERQDNVKGVFEFCGSLMTKNVLLVDDVYTTGATAKECVRVLKRAGVKNVWTFTLARKLRI